MEPTPIRNCHRRLVIVAVLSAICACPGLGLAQSTVLSDNPPAAFKSAFDDAIRDPEERRERALTRLGNESDWEPYFRPACNSLSDDLTRDRLRPALEKCRSRLLSWNLERAQVWAKERRFDYLAAIASQVTDPEQAKTVGSLVFDAQKVVRHRFREVARSTTTNANSFLAYPLTFADFSASKGFRRFAASQISNPKEQSDLPTFMHAPFFKPVSRNHRAWLVLANEMRASASQDEWTNWSYSVLVVNSNCNLNDIGDLLVVCDGDVEFARYGGCSSSLIVCTGSIRTPPKREFELGNGTVMCAGEDFVGRDDAWNKSVTILTGGKNASALPPDKSGAKYFREGVKENPFGIKFVSPEDAGIELDIGVRVVRLGKLQESSPLAKAGLERGDWVKSLNGVSIETAAEFRRQLRESLLWGTGLFEIKRGDQTFLRLVKFAEPPKK
jgi:hypothetical protein